MKTLPPFALLGLLSALSAAAQTPPDAGQTLQQLQPPLVAPRETKPLNIQSPAQTEMLPGGAQVVLKAISFSGNTVFDELTLLKVLDSGSGPVIGKSFDLSGLRALAQRISEHYRVGGYPFASAYIAAQDLGAGALRIDIVEGRYGKVSAQSDDPALAVQAQKMLDTLRPGDLIQSTPLERVALKLEDLPGITVTPVMRPGQANGTGDFEVGIARAKQYSGDVSLDNQGNRYSGENRLQANLNINSPFMLGDQISIRGLASDEHLLLGSLTYSALLGASGLRGNIGYAHTSYTLGKDFASLQANGTAAVASLGLSYPLVRSQGTNLSLSATYQDKSLKDNKDQAGTKETKTSQSLPITLQFDKRDTNGGGITYGTFSWTPGKLNLDANLANTDVISGAHTQGSFNKLNLEVVRLQSMGGSWSLMGRLSAQWASKNLDSSEKMSLGGANGVRAYPSGEASGDEAWLTQLELRYASGAYAPFVFMDAGGIRPNAKPDQLTSAPPSRDLAGLGVGLRYQRTNWNLNTTLAWRTKGGLAQSDTSGDPKPRVWVSLGSSF